MNAAGSIRMCFGNGGTERDAHSVLLHSKHHHACACYKGALYEEKNDMAEAYAVQTTLGVSEVLSLLQRLPPNPLTSPPQRPKANEVYLFEAESKENKVI